MPTERDGADSDSRAVRQTLGVPPGFAGSRPPLRLPGLAFVILAAAVVWAACDGGQASLEVTVEPGRVSCEAFHQFESYRYRTEVVLDLEERDPSMEPSDPYGRDAFKFTQVVEGAVQQGDRIEATLESPELEGPGTSVIVIEDIVWISLAGDWTARPLTEIDAFPIPYLPEDTCNAIAPDIDVSGLTGTPEMVGEIASQKYHFDAFQSDLPDRHPSFTPQSDAARIVNDYEGDIWIADEGSYVSKLDITGMGTYENGRQLTFSIFLELSDINDDSIRVEPPT